MPAIVARRRPAGTSHSRHNSAKTALRPAPYCRALMNSERTLFFRRLRLQGTTVAVLAGALLLALWDSTALDLVTARWFGSASGFPLRDDWWLVRVLHDGVRQVAWVWTVALTIGVWWPWGPLRRIAWADRLTLAVSVLLSLGIVVAIKGTSHTSCPWDLAEFGGIGRYVSHWRWSALDGGSGHCFPGGHASTGFAFMAGYFAFRQQAPRVARRWLVCALIAGGVFGGVQQLRGAHFMSHTLWTSWLCWTTAWGIDQLRRRFARTAQQPAIAPTTPA